MKPLTVEEFNSYRQMAHYAPLKRTMAAYIMEPSEIGARAKEIELIGQLKFKTLDNLFRETNKMAIPEINKNVFVLNSVRSQSASA